MANQTWPVQTGWLVSTSSRGTSEADGASLGPFHATVPSDVHTVLLEEGVIADPFVRYNVNSLQWIGQQVWKWETTVERPALDGSKTDFVDILRFDGLDTYATVFINDVEIARHRNMFTPLEIELKHFIHAGASGTVGVSFTPPLSAGEVVSNQWGYYAPNERVPHRKAAAQYEWDHTPRLLNVGIWRGVWIDRYWKGRMTDCHVRVLSADSRTAVVQVTGEIDQWAGGGPSVALVLEQAERRVESVASVRNSQFSITVQLDDPELWWPNGHGGQPLYDLTAKLIIDGELCDRWCRRVGIRTVCLNRDPNPLKPGRESFTFVVNGRPIFAQGANWVPTDLLNGRVRRDR